MRDEMRIRRRIEIFTKQSDVAELSEYGEIRLGGITLYGTSPHALADAVVGLEAEVESIVRRSPSADKNWIRALLHADVQGLDRRVVSAIIGSVLRQGRIAAVQGEDAFGELSLIVCASERRAEFDARVEALEARLRALGQTTIKRLQKVFFPKDDRGAWTWTWHLAARAAYRGRACFIDPYHIASAGEFDNVLGAPG